MPEQNFSDIGRVAAIESLFEGTGFSNHGKCSFIAASSEKITTASRLFLEGIDFDLVYFPLKHLGYKTVVSVTGELYASLSTPRSLDVKIGLSSKLDLKQTKELWQGIVAAAKEYSYTSLSLDLLPSKNGLAISVSASGKTFSDIDFPKPQTKDLICVSGRLGAAYLGFEALERAKKAFEKDGVQPDLEKYRMMVGAYLKPEIDANILSNLKESAVIPSSGYLITRGLADAVKRLSADTGLGAKIYVDKIPFEGNSFEFGKEMDIDPVSAAMNGGEDCQLLYTIPISKYETFRHDFQTFDIIGHLALPEAGAVLVTPDGAELPIHAQGWPDSQE